jgi:hypothetical protein
MTYGVVVTVSAPVELYDQLHSELLRTVDGIVEGLLLHFGRPVEGGFQVVEIWESREQSDRYNREVVWPLTAQVFHDHPPAADPVTEEFEIRGLLLPSAGIVF